MSPPGLIKAVRHNNQRERLLRYAVYIYNVLVTAVVQWLRRCATNRKIAGSIPAGIIGIFH